MEISTSVHLNFLHLLFPCCVAQRQQRSDALIMIHFVNEYDLNIGMCTKCSVSSMGISLIILRRNKQEVITIIISKVLNKELQI